MRDTFVYRLGMLGGGPGSLIGETHRIAARIAGSFQLVGGAFSSDFAVTQQFGRQLQLESHRLYDTVETLISEELRLPPEERMQVVSVVTPNAQHFPMSRALVEAGFHVICEKPMTISVEEAEALAEIVHERRVMFALAHTYTGYPMVRQMRAMVREGMIGDIQKIDSRYYQGWLNPILRGGSDREPVWRLDPGMAGLSCCTGDIGVHAFNLVEYVSGLTVDQVLAETHTLTADNGLDVDASMLIRANNGSKGVICASQIATGEENDVSLALYGQKGALKWSHRVPDSLTYLPEGAPEQTLTAGQAYLHAETRAASRLPQGHPEGMYGAMANIYGGVAQALDGTGPSDAVPDAQAGVRGMRFIAAVLASQASGQIWVPLD
jgi:predicted dehydrogenase